MKRGAIIVGAGQGERLGQDRPKGLVLIEGVPLLLLATWAFQQTQVIDALVLVVPAGWEDEIEQQCARFKLAKVSAVVAGGVLRQDSVLAGLNLFPEDFNSVLIHDAARPFITVDVITQCVAQLNQAEAVVVGTPVIDTLHRARAGQTSSGPARSQLVAVQTPQGFSIARLRQAFELGRERKLEVTDEVTLVREALGLHAQIVPGKSSNIKITHPEDLHFYQPQLQELVTSLKEAAR